MIIVDNIVRKIFFIKLTGLDMCWTALKERRSRLIVLSELGWSHQKPVWGH